MRSEPRRRLLVALAALLLFALTARLGFWQLDRANTKLGLQAARDAADRLPPLTQLQGAQEHRLARLTGEWQPQWQIWLGNRPLDRQVGYVLLTPLRLDDGSLLWVQRGWQPRRDSGYSAPPWPATPTGRVELQGRLSRQASRAFELGAGDQGALRQNLDLAVPPAPGQSVQAWVLWQTQDCAPLRCDWPAPDLGVSKHHGYAAQWFALSALTLGLYVWFQLIAPRRRRAA